MIDEAFSHFYLVGGTALSLWLGHRKSIDLDFFVHSDFDAQTVAYSLENDFDAKNIETGKNLVRCFISSIKIEFIAHQYPLIENVYKKDNIRLVGLKDISAFKLNAVVNRGSKKDFWDIAYLLNQFTINEILNFYGQKYRKNNLWQVEKSLCYFDDANNEQVEIIDFKNLSWEFVKDAITKESKKAF